MKSWERVKDVVEEAPDIIIHTRHRILLPWTLAEATYLEKRKKERLRTLLSETTSPNNLRLISTETTSFPLCGRRCDVHQDRQ